jgi:methionyl-tRNA formyltransferase
MRIEETLDTGPILVQSEVAIETDDVAGTLQARLAQCGAEILLQALQGLEGGALKATPQDESQATYAPKLRKEDGIIRWDRGAVELANLIRGVTPWPGAMTVHRGKSLRIWRARPIPMPGTGSPAKVAKIDRLGVCVETGDGYLGLIEVQPAGGRRMEAAAYARGHGLRVGDLLGP